MVQEGPGMLWGSPLNGAGRTSPSDLQGWASVIIGSMTGGYIGGDTSQLCPFIGNC